MDPIWTTLIQAGVSLVTGGVAGAAVNAFITSRRQRLDVTLTVIRDFFEYYERIGKVKGFFTASDLKKTLDNSANMNLFRLVGDWYHYVASLDREGAIEALLLDKVGVTKEITSFREAITAAKSRCPEHLDHVWGWWPNLQDFGIKK